MLEDRSRRSILRITGLSEESEGRNCVSFLQEHLPRWLPALANKHIEIERAHRTGKARGFFPRALIFKLLNFKDKELILQAAREKNSPILHGSDQIRLFQDFSRETAQRRKAFQPIRKGLRELSIPSFLLFPSTLKVLRNGKAEFYTTPESARAAFNELGGLENPPPRASVSPPAPHPEL